ncbi:MAG: HNH endonuclease [Thermodesulfovibrionales bacterium]|nr:HNH endonuclease [Thermodesulfovibrionales bacterium]
MSYLEENYKKERRNARRLRKTTWWRRKLSKGRCYYCNNYCHPKELTMDHVIPLSRGGKSERLNIVPSCKECNNNKKYLLPIEWKEYLNSLQQEQHKDQIQ